MHSYVIDWLRDFHLDADDALSVLAGKRWKLAETVANQLSRKDLLLFLRAFLFSPVSPELIQTLTQQFKEIDHEFPGSQNVKDVRLQAGIVMVFAFEQRTTFADAFALGLKASDFQQKRLNPAETGIVDEAAKYLNTEAQNVRPLNFGKPSDRTTIIEKLEALGTTVDSAGSRSVAPAKLADTLQEIYGEQLRRAGEEIGLLWWLIGGYCSALNLETTKMEDGAYALIAAAEAAERTQLLPPPPSIHAILARALAPCEATKKSKNTIEGIVGLADATWRHKFVTAHPAGDCADLVPLVTALGKTDETGEVAALAKTLPRICLGLVVDCPLSPTEAARQLYNELMFLQAMAAID